MQVRHERERNKKSPCVYYVEILAIQLRATAASPLTAPLTYVSLLSRGPELYQAHSLTFCVSSSSVLLSRRLWRLQSLCHVCRFPVPESEGVPTSVGLRQRVLTVRRYRRGASLRQHCLRQHCRWCGEQGSWGASCTADSCRV